MNANVIDSGIKKRINFPSSALALIALGFDVKDSKPDHFKIKKTKVNGVWMKAVWLHFDNGFELNLSIHTGVFALNKKEALKFCIKYAKDHGFKPRLFIRIVTKPNMRAL